jgi:hypothetical protein
METTTPKHPKFVRWALMLGIVIILNIFFNVLVALALPAPDYNAYCPNINGPAPMDAKSCDTLGGVWTDNGPAIAPAPMPKPVSPTGYCDMYAKCQPLYQAASDKHSLYAFVFMVGLGVLALIIGLMPFGSSMVSTGLSYGGVLAFVIGSASYWGTAGNWIRLAIATVGLLALVYIGWKRFKD